MRIAATLRLITLLFVWSTSVSGIHSPVRLFASRGGGAESKNVSQTLADYVTAMEEKDANHEDIRMIQIREDEDKSSSPESSTPEGSTASSDGEAVGVKSKKSNAVGDPDDDSEDDHDDDDISDWEDLDDDAPQPLQVEVEVVEQQVAPPSAARGSGGVGVRLGRRRRNKKKRAASTVAMLVNAWMPHLYLPATPGQLNFMKGHARSIDAAAKARLDRRTLYSGLMLEFIGSSNNARKYFSKQTSQQLQAALSLATQPQWRAAFPQTSAIMFYEPDDDKSVATLSIQETIAMSLVSFQRVPKASFQE
jgi:hypothetical protein